MWITSLASGIRGENHSLSRASSVCSHSVNVTSSVVAMGEDASLDPAMGEDASLIDDDSIDSELRDLELQYLREAARSGRHLFITGGGGTGKTTEGRRLMEDFAARNIPTAVVAPTGIAARQYPEGVTFYQYANRGLFDQPVRAIMADKKYVAEWKAANCYPDGVRVVIFVDEVSMFGDLFFNNVVAFLDEMHGVGNYQMIVLGDFLQLGPLPKYGVDTPRYAFHSTAWKRLHFVPVLLTQNQRIQGHDQDLHSNLALTRLGVNSPEVCAFWHSLELSPADDVNEHVHLFPNNRGADNYCDTRRSTIPGPNWTVLATYYYQSWNSRAVTSTQKTLSRRHSRRGAQPLIGRDYSQGGRASDAKEELLVPDTPSPRKWLNRSSCGTLYRTRCKPECLGRCPLLRRTHTDPHPTCPNQG